MSIDIKKGLNSFFQPMLEVLDGLMFSKKGLNSPQIITVTGAMIEIVENCDSEGLKEQLFFYLQHYYNQVCLFIEQPSNIFPHISQEELDIISSHVCSLFQPLLYAIGHEKLNDDIVLSFVNLATKVFDAN